MSDYEFDLFLSYRRSGNVQDWVWNHFRPVLHHCLADELDREPRIFLDVEIDTGTRWPDRLEEALRGSRLLLPVLSPQYFRSAWCLAEWRSAADREALVGGDCNLMYPVVFADRENFPAEARRRQARDLKPWNIPYPQFRETPAYIPFHQEVQKIAQEIAARLHHVPPWRPDWPVVRPPLPVIPPTAVPSLS
ncbi:toll/interleukin-1 receptor domain-containing protein [Saccharothrix xinjiangensis]|uniref:TIR domain-containing protein n=1 Tax=Saccharothrix xinjiangensis TaxID=204798 RepID=A0ABV9Y6K8_9PSEU